MTAPIDPGAARAPQGVEPTRAKAAPKVASQGPDGGIAFRALLERLQEKATRLEASSRGVGGPGELLGAVDEARSSLADALSLGDQVLEAFRNARQTGSLTENVPGASERDARGGRNAS